MKKQVSLFLLAIFLPAVTLAKVSAIPTDIQQQMKKYTWRSECPVPLTDLVYVKLNYWGFDNKPHSGTLIVHKELGNEVDEIFKTLYTHHFPIQRMDLMDIYKGDDEAAMEANNTSSFNCRAVTGKPGVFSQHSYGRAIDINTMINPYVKGKTVLPTNGAPFVDRSKPYPGKITKGDFVYNEFIKHGWIWGGDWHDLQDYQHFEKRANNEKRNPDG